MPATLHTTDSFFAHVHEHGFSGLSPGKNDTMGDTWSRAISALFDRTIDASSVARERRHKLWMLWQWLYCELAGMRGRVIATPPAMRIAGIEISDEDVSDAIQLLLDSQDH